MKAHIGRSVVHGAVSVPGSKSYTIRAAMCAAMAGGESVIEGALESDDTAAVLACLRALGVVIRDTRHGLCVRGGQLRAAESPLWCRESGATFRFLAALAATIPAATTLRCAPSLARRPLQPLLAALEQLGAKAEFDAAEGMLVVTGRCQSSGTATLRGDVSSQFLSALLIAGPRYDNGICITLSSPVVSKRYVAMTCDCMARFGVQVDVSHDGRSYRVAGDYAPTRYRVEGDWSGAAAVLAAGALAGDVSVSELHPASLQADVAMLDLLQRVGARIDCRDGVVVAGRTSLPTAFTMDLADAIDLLPVACALGAAAGGVSTLTGIARARDKESDRVAAMAEGLANLGVLVEVAEDEMRIRGGTARGGMVSAAGDHRIAMAFGVLGAAVGDVVVDGAECVSKTYPGFWDMLACLGVEVTLHE